MLFKKCRLTNLTNLLYGDSDFRWNALFAPDSATEAFITEKQIDGDWESTQTVAPSDLSAVDIAVNSVTLGWTAVSYQADPGGYQVEYLHHLCAQRTAEDCFSAGGVLTGHPALLVRRRPQRQIDVACQHTVVGLYAVTGRKDVRDARLHAPVDANRVLRTGIDTGRSGQRRIWLHACGHQHHVSFLPETVRTLHE